MNFIYYNERMKYMPHSKPLMPSGLQIFSSLNARMNLTSNDKRIFHNLQKGYEGELKFSRFLEKGITGDCIQLYDLLLESNQSEFQIDNLLIYQDTIFMNEVKYHEGDFLVSGDKWYMISSEKEIRNPIFQLQRSEFLLRQLLQQIGFHFNVEAKLVFVHPEFTLYQAPYDQPIVFPTQLNRYIKQLNHTPSRLTDKHHNLAKQLIHRHITTSRHERLPDYHYDDLKKGILCNACGGFMITLSIFKLNCNNCGYGEYMDSGIMRTVSEFHKLFPNRKITTSAINNWCNNVCSKKSIRNVLMKNMNFVQNGKYSYYTFNKKPHMTRTK